MPIKAERSWPKMALRGWERGESMVWYSSIAAAPCVLSVPNLERFPSRSSSGTCDVELELGLSPEKG